jgi:hypothetical protein
MHQQGKPAFSVHSETWKSHHNLSFRSSLCYEIPMTTAAPLAQPPFLKPKEEEGEKRKKKVLGTLPGALIRCLRQRLFDASVVDQVSKNKHPKIQKMTEEDQSLYVFDKLQELYEKKASHLWDALLSTSKYMQLSGDMLFHIPSNAHQIHLTNI